MLSHPTHALNPCKSSYTRHFVQPHNFYEDLNIMHKSFFITSFSVGLLTYWTFSSGLVTINLDANALPLQKNPTQPKPRGVANHAQPNFFTDFALSVGINRACYQFLLFLSVFVCWHEKL